VPVVTTETNLSDTLEEISRKGLGMTTVVDSSGHLSGIFTDGDLRRLLDHGQVDIRQMKVEQVMTSKCTTVRPEMLAAEALQIMDSRSVNALPVIDAEGNLQGALNMHDLLRAGVV